MTHIPQRDSVTTIAPDGSRRFLQPGDVTGQWVRARRAFGWLLIALFAAMPWIDIHGNPAVFLDIEQRHFYLFGVTLGLDDFWLLFFAISGLGFTVYAVTAMFGRIWCGWACPQTVYMEHLFRWVDRWIEGDHLQRTRLDSLPFSHPEKLRKRGFRFLVYVVLCWLVSHIFLAYFVSIPGLYPLITGAPTAHPTAFIGMAAMTAVLLFNFWWFREQLCLAICPYGRLQSALIDDNSVIVGYDARRGEPRGKAVAGITTGDCIDCRRCVQVCPTGIDIRQGLQMECIACTSCIDACDDIMTKLQRPVGLVRYASLNELNGGQTQYWRPRTILYAALFGIGAVVATLSLSQIQTAGFKLTRQPGVELYTASPGAVTNFFRAKILNKQGHAVRFFVETDFSPVPITILNQSTGLLVGPEGEVTLPLIIMVDRAHYTGEFNLTVRLRSEDGKTQLKQKLHFLGPEPAEPTGAKPPTR